MARKNVSAIVSGAGFAASFWTALDKAVRAKGGGDEDIYRLGTPEGELLIEQFAKIFLADAKTPKPKLLLDFIGTITIPATTEKFVACDRFVVNTSRQAPVKISYLGNNFKEWFLGKTEEPINGTTLRYQKLRKYSLDGPIIAELGGEAKVETTLTEVFSLMECQKNGEDGVLNNFYANIFYARDISGVLRAVVVGWYDGGWYVDAYSVEGLRGWFSGSRVFSSN